MKNVSNTVLAMAIAAAVAGPVKADPVSDILNTIGLSAAQLSSQANALPSQMSAGFGFSQSSPLVGVTVFEPANRLNAQIAALSVGSGDNTGNGAMLGGAAVLAGNNSGNGGAIGAAVLSGTNSGHGDVLSIRALNQDEAVALGLGDRNSDIISLGGASALTGTVEPLSAGRLNQPLRDALGREVGLGGAVYDGLDSVGSALASGSSGGINIGESGSVIAHVFGGDNAASDGIVGASVLGGAESANRNLVGAAVLSGDNSAQGGVVNVAVLSGEGSAKGGLVNAGALNKGSGLVSDPDANPAALNANVIDGSESSNGLVAASVTSTTAKPGPELPTPDPKSVSDAGTNAERQCGTDPESTFNGQSLVGPELNSQFSSPRSETDATDCSAPQNLASNQSLTSG